MAEKITRRGFLGLLVGAAAALVAAPLRVLAGEPEPAVGLPDGWNKAPELSVSNVPYLSLHSPDRINQAIAKFRESYRPPAGSIRVEVGGTDREIPLKPGWNDLSISIDHEAWDRAWATDEDNNKSVRAYWFSAHAQYLPTEKDLG